MTSSEVDASQYNTSQPGSSGIALYDYDNKEDPGHLQLKAGETIVLINNVDWQWGIGRSMQSDQGGLFPLSYVDFSDSGMTSEAMAGGEGVDDVVGDRAEGDEEKGEAANETSEPEIMSDEERARRTKQLQTEFNHHLLAGLSDGAAKSNTADWMNYALNQADEEAVNDAIQRAAAKFAQDIHGQFGDYLNDYIAKAPYEPWRAPLASSFPLRNADDYADFLGSFADEHLPRFYGADSDAVKQVASKAASIARDESKIAPRLLPGVAKLALYDFVFLCDNSGSMEEEDRIDTLEDTLQRVLDFTTLLTPSGISVRVLHSGDDRDAEWDDLRTPDEVMHKMQQVSYEGSTPLGTRLWHKILSPKVVEKARRGELERPVMVIIITDGEANDEEITLDASISHCESELRSLGYPPASVVYLISRVGTSEEARAFIEGLGTSEGIADTVYVSPADMGAKRNVFRHSGNESAYTNSLIKLCLAALQVRTK